MASEGQDDRIGADASMISNNSPYQPTTEPVSHKSTECLGMIVDIQYLKSIQSILKMVEILFCIVILICIGSVVTCSPCTGLGFLQAVTIGAFIVTIILLVVNGLSLTKKIPIIHWILTDLLNAAIATVLFIISSSVLASQAREAADKAAIAFGFITAILYGVSAWMAYRLFIVDRHKRRSHVSHVQGHQENA